MKKITFLSLTILFILISILNVFALSPDNLYDLPYWCTFDFGGSSYKVYFLEVEGKVRKETVGSQDYLAYKDAEVLAYRIDDDDWYLLSDDIAAGTNRTGIYYCDYTTFNSNFVLYDEYTGGEEIYNPTKDLIANPADGHIYDTYQNIVLDKNYIYEYTTYKLTVKDKYTSRIIYETSFSSLSEITENFVVPSTDFPQADGDYIVTVTNYETGQVYDENTYTIAGTKEIVKIVGIEEETYNYCPMFQVVHQSESPHYLFFNNKMIAYYRKTGTFRYYSDEIDWQLGENKIEIRDYDDNVIDSKSCNILRLEPSPEVNNDGLLNDSMKPRRENYQDGILGDLQYGFDMLVYWITLPFVFIGESIKYIADWLSSIIATIGEFSSKMGELFLFLPLELRTIIYTAITVIILISIIKAVR